MNAICFSVFCKFYRWWYSAKLHLILFQIEPLITVTGITHSIKTNGVHFTSGNTRYVSLLIAFSKTRIRKNESQLEYWPNLSRIGQVKPILQHFENLSQNDWFSLQNVNIEENVEPTSDSNSQTNIIKFDGLLNLHKRSFGQQRKISFA